MAENRPEAEKLPDEDKLASVLEEIGRMGDFTGSTGHRPSDGILRARIRRDHLASLDETDNHWHLTLSGRQFLSRRSRRGSADLLAFKLRASKTPAGKPSGRERG